MSVYSAVPPPGITTGTSTKTMLQLLAPAGKKLKILRLGISFNGVVAADAPIQVLLYRQTTSGTFSNTLTPAPLDADDSASGVTASYNPAAEPTNGALLDAWYVHPQTGVDLFLPLTEEVYVAGGARIAIVVLAGVSVSAIPKIWWHE